MMKACKKTISGNIPENWKELNVSDIGELKTSSVDKKIRPNDKLVNLVNYMNVYNKQILKSVDTCNLMQVTANQNQLESSNLLKGDVLFTPSSETPEDIGHSIAIFEDLENTLYSYHLIRLRPEIIIDTLFSHYLFNANYVRKQISKLSAGTTRFTISIKNLSKITVFLPTLNEQKKIAKILSALDAKIEVINQRITKTQELKKGLIRRLLTKGISHTEFKESSLGMIPESWEIVKLDDVSKRGSGHTPNKQISEYYNGGVKWVSLGDSKRLDNRWIEQTKIEISKEGIKNSSAVLHPKGTVLLSRDAGVGKSAVMKTEMGVSQHFITWHCKELLNNWFLYYILQDMKPTFERVAIGSTIKTIGLGFFKKMTIALPPKKEQDKIADILNSIDDKLEVLSKKKTQYQELKQGLMHQLLTGKIKVKV